MSGSSTYSSNPAPGTVSRILWHFTGGPTWLENERRQSANPKPTKQAYHNLKSILESRTLRLGSYKEIVTVTIPEVSRLDRRTGRVERRKNVRREVTSVPVCCLSDIPAQHLGYHASRYGKCAIGFHRSGVVSHGFNPVFYSLQDSSVLLSIYHGLSKLDAADAYQIGSAADDISRAAPNLGDDADELADMADSISSEADLLADTIQSARDGFSEFVAFVKTFVEDEFSTVYCEREWRSVKAFEFPWSDVAMIVLPYGRGRDKYYQKFTKQVIPKLSLPRAIPVVPWEDLVEH